MTGGVRRDVNIARGTTVPLVICEHQTGKTVVGRDVPCVSIVAVNYKDNVYTHE
jgi:hypothetical protein